MASPHTRGDDPRSSQPCLWGHPEGRAHIPTPPPPPPPQRSHTWPPPDRPRRPSPPRHPVLQSPSHRRGPCCGARPVGCCSNIPRLPQLSAHTGTCVPHWEHALSSWTASPPPAALLQQAPTATRHGGLCVWPTRTGCACLRASSQVPTGLDCVVSHRVTSRHIASCPIMPYHYISVYLISICPQCKAVWS